VGFSVDVGAGEEYLGRHIPVVVPDDPAISEKIHDAFSLVGEVGPDLVGHPKSDLDEHGKLLERPHAIQFPGLLLVPRFVGVARRDDDATAGAMDLAAVLLARNPP